MIWKWITTILVALPVFATPHQPMQPELGSRGDAVALSFARLATQTPGAALPDPRSASNDGPRIIIRHDVPDERYRALGEQYRRTFVDLSLPAPDGTPQHGNTGGTLIDPHWVVTAAHAAMGIWKDDPRSPLTGRPSVYFNGTAYPIERVFLHPDWVAGTKRSSAPLLYTSDIALVKLAVPVEGGEPACLYPGQDEAGQIATIVGTGTFGTGLTGPAGDIGTLRGATVTINPLRDARVLEWNFRDPDDPLVTELEGISGPGDSGGPAFLMHEGRLCVAGVSATQFSEREEGLYGVLEVYPRISHYRPWLEAVMRGEHGTGIELRGTGTVFPEISAERLSSYIGSYAGNRRVFERSGTLYWQVGDNFAWPMVPIGPDEFALGFRLVPTRLRFESENGRVVKAQLIRPARPADDIERVH